MKTLKIISIIIVIIISDILIFEVGHHREDRISIDTTTTTAVVPEYTPKKSIANKTDSLEFVNKMQVFKNGYMQGGITAMNLRDKTPDELFRLFMAQYRKDSIKIRILLKSFQ